MYAIGFSFLLFHKRCDPWKRIYFLTHFTSFCITFCPSTLRQRELLLLRHKPIIWNFAGLAYIPFSLNQSRNFFDHLLVLLWCYQWRWHMHKLLCRQQNCIFQTLGRSMYNRSFIIHWRIGVKVQTPVEHLLTYRLKSTIWWTYFDFLLAIS